MIGRAHGLALSLFLGAAAAAGAYAIIVTAHLGDAETKPEVVSSRQIAKQARKLDAWEASLQKTLKTRPPALPALNRYAAVMFVAAPGATTLPVVASVPRRAAQQTERARKAATEAAGKTRSKPVGRAATPGRNDDASEGAVPVVVAAPERNAPAAPAAPAAAVVVVAAAPAATTASAPTPPATLSVEQQCRQLLLAAEGKSEQVKQDAEKQCEALKQAAEKKG